MEYDATNDALTKPETRLPLAVDDQWSLAARCAELSRLAYFRAELDAGAAAQVAAGLAAAGYGPATSFRGDAILPKRSIGTYAFAVRDGAGRAFVVFRGTQPDDLGDLIDDVRFWPKDLHNGVKVHGGFLRAYNSLKGDIDAWLAALDPQPAELIVTGHSLGAAMATLMASLNCDATLVTFGSPRVGGPGLAQMFAGRPVHRYVDCNDFVTNLAPPIWFRHVAGMHYIDRHGVVRDKPPGLWQRALDRVRGDFAYFRRFGIRSGHVPFRTAADHAPINYVAAVLGVRVGP